MATVNKDFVVRNGVIAGEEVQGTQLVATTSSEAPLIVTSTASVANLNADLLDGQHGSHYLDFNNSTNKPSPTITFTGDVTGSVTLTNLQSASAALTIDLLPIELGVDTDGNYVESLAPGTGVFLSASVGEGISSTISIGQDVSVSASPTFAHLTITQTSGAPLTVSSSAQVDNLNSQFLGGYSAEEIISSGGVQSVVGTADEVEVSASVGNIQIGLPENVTIAGNLHVTKNLLVTGSTTVINSTVVSVEDPVFSLGSSSATFDDGLDRGIEFRWYDDGEEEAKIGFFGFDSSTGKFAFIPDATNTSEVFSGNRGEIDANISWARVINKPTSTITLLGDVSGSGTLFDLGSASITVTVEKDFNLQFTGDVTGTGTVSNLNSASIALTIAPNSIELGTDTTGNYVADVTAGNGITITGTAGEGWSPTISLNTATASVNWANVNDKPDPVITLQGDVSGSGTLTDLNSASITVTVEKDFDLTFTGDVTGTGTVNNLGSASIALTIAANSVALGADTTGNYVANIFGTEDQVLVAGSGTETASVVLSLPQSIGVTSTPAFAGVEFTNGLITTSTVTVVSNDTPTVIDAIGVSTFTTAEYVIQAKQGTKMTSTKALVMWDGTNAYISEYAIVDSSAGAANIVLSVSESGGNLSLTAESPDAATTNVVIKAVRTAIDA